MCGWMHLRSKCQLDQLDQVVCHLNLLTPAIFSGIVCLELCMEENIKFFRVVDYVCEAAAWSHLLLERQVGFWKKMIAPKTLQNSCCHVCRPWSSWDTMQNITHAWTRFCEGNCFVCECLFSTLIDCRRFGEADASWARGVGIAFTTWN